MSIKKININELRELGGKQGLILQGCGGNLDEWLDGINQHFTEREMLLEGTKFTEYDCVSFDNNEITCLLFKFNSNIKLDMGKLAVWRLQTIDDFHGVWLTDFVDQQLGGFNPTPHIKNEGMEIT